MAGTTETHLSPETAVETLRGLERYEEGLSARAGGLTWMVWGIAAAGIFATYNAADFWQLEGTQNAVLGVLWAPWIVAATIVTAGLWRTLSVKMRSEEAPGTSWLVTAGFTLLFFAIWGLLRLLGLDLPTAALMVIVVGVFTAALGTIQSLAKWCPAWPGIFAGAVLVAAGSTMGLLELSGVGAGYLGAFTVLAVYFPLGLWFYLRG